MRNQCHEASFSEFRVLIEGTWIIKTVASPFLPFRSRPFSWEILRQPQIITTFLRQYNNSLGSLTPIRRRHASKSPFLRVWWCCLVVSFSNSCSHTLEERRGLRRNATPSDKGLVVLTGYAVIFPNNATTCELIFQSFQFVFLNIQIMS